MKNIQYVGPSDAVEMVIGSTTVVAKRGEPIKVADDVAGTASDPRVAEAMLELRTATAAHDHLLAQSLKEEIIGLDMGSGLLAQADWVLVDPKSKTPVEDN